MCFAVAQFSRGRGRTSDWNKMQASDGCYLPGSGAYRRSHSPRVNRLLCETLRAIYGVRKAIKMQIRWMNPTAAKCNILPSLAGIERHSSAGVITAQVLQLVCMDIGASGAGEPCRPCVPNPFLRPNLEPTNAAQHMRHRVRGFCFPRPTHTFQRLPLPRTSPTLNPGHHINSVCWYC